MTQLKKYSYFNEEEFYRILSLKQQHKYYQFEKVCCHYLEQYPYDCRVFNLYASFFIEFGKLEEAEKILSQVQIQKGTKEEDIYQIRYTKMKLLGFQEKFEECYQLFQENREYFKQEKKGFYFIEAYLRNQLNLLQEISEEHSYAINQIVQYSDQAALDHIRTNHLLENIEDKSFFLEDFPLEEIYFHIKNILPSLEEKKVLSSIFKNEYIFYYPHCGMDQETPLNYIRIFTFQNSNQMITMFPSNNWKQYPVTDLSNLQEKKSDSKIKRLSQIEKFQQRYKNY